MEEPSMARHLYNAMHEAATQHLIALKRHSCQAPGNNISNRPARAGAKGNSSVVNEMHPMRAITARSTENKGNALHAKAYSPRHKTLHHI
jgi:hypothetical protein